MSTKWNGGQAAKVRRITKRGKSGKRKKKNG